MMIHLIDNDTKETFKSFGDNEVQAAIAAARASGKIVTMDLDENNEHCRIFITSDTKADLITKLAGEEHKVTVLITETAETITETVKKLMPILTEATQQISAAIGPIVDAVGELGEFGETRAPSEIKKEIKHTKNPMRLSQLYKELNASYKTYGRKHK